MKKVRELSLILIVIGIIFVILSIGITPQIVDEVLLADRQIDSVYLQKLWIYRIVFFLIGGLLLSIGLLWGKHYKKILKFFDKHRVALSVKHGRIILAIGLGFHTFIYLLKTKV